MKIFCVLFACLHVASAQSKARGVKIKSQKASVELGVKGDVALRRNNGALKIDAKYVQAAAFKVGNMDLDAYIEAAVRKRIKPHIKDCEAGYKGPFCDQKCTNANPKTEDYSVGCTTVCKKGYAVLKGKCINVSGAPCPIKNSNMQPGKACKCKPFFGGTITWKGAVAVGQCKACGLVSGFNADFNLNQLAGTGWTELKNWRTNINNELYENNGEFNNAQGRFYPKQSGYYLCNANVRFDQFSGSYSRVLIAVNGKKDVNNGLHTIEGNGGSTNYRSMMVSGTVQLKKGQFASVYTFSSNDNSYRIQTETGFSCHRLDSNVGFHAEKNGNQKIGVRKWTLVSKWRVTGTLGVYNAGKGFSVSKSRYTSPSAGVHYCYAMTRMDKASRQGFIRLNLNLNGKPDVSNGFHAIRGNKDSTNYGSLNLAGTIYLKKGDYTSVYVFSSVDSDWTIHSESGWGCHHLASNVGFHADAISNQKFGRYWSRVAKWRTAGNNELYAMGGAGVSAQGFFTAPYTGHYVCATQVRVDLVSVVSYSYFRVLLAVDGQLDVNNGMHSIDGNQGSTNYRTMRVAGIVRLNKGQKISVHVYSYTDTAYTLNQESGFSCNRLKSRPACPACKIKNSNMKRGKECACKVGYTGKIVWKGNTATGTCKPAACKVANSNKKGGPLCKCKDGYKGKITWKLDKATGKCTAAPCWIPGSNNKPGPACKCKDLHTGKLTWKGAQVTGSCNICGANSGFNADLQATQSIKKNSWTEITKWRTNANNEMYETKQKEFDNAKGRFTPKKPGYYLCNANVRLDNFMKQSYSRLIIAIKGKKDSNNGLHTIEGNGGSTNYRSMMVSGNLQLKKGEYASVFVYSSGDKDYKIQGESGFSCHRFNTMTGFRADKNGNMAMKAGFVEITNWRVSGTPGLYNKATGGGFNLKTGRYTVLRAGGGVFFCTASVRMDATSTTGYFRVNMVVNRQNDYSNGMHAIRGNKGSTNYGTLNLAGTLKLAKGQFVSLVTYSSSDNTWRVQSETGFGCHRMNTKVGFHADQIADLRFTKTGWVRITNWRTTGNNELYSLGNARVTSGFFVAPVQGYYACATQVRVQYALSTGNNYFRLLLAINNQMDVNNGLHSIDGNGGSTNYRSMRVAGTVYLRKGHRVSVNIYSRSDASWTAQHESGFSCHMFDTHVVACPKCNIANSNKVGGPACKCVPGYKGTVKYDRKTQKMTGKCTKSKCAVKNSNMADGAKCACKTFFNGQVTWTEKGATGSCRACGAAKGFNADLQTSIVAKAGWREVKQWRTNGNNEMYESDNSFQNGNGRFMPKQDGYYLCNANVRLDGFTNKGFSRLIIAISGKKDVNNGLHTVENDGGSTNYRSMMISGTLQLKKTEYASVFIFSSNDNNYRIQTESGFSCQLLHSPYGFHAEKSNTQNMGTGWKEVPNWRIKGTAGLYNVGGGFDAAKGRYTAQQAGVHYCYAMVRMDGADVSYFRLSLNLNNGLDVNNGFHAIRGNRDSKKYGTSNVAGTINLKKGNRVSVYVYARSDKKWQVNTQSGWGCHRLGSNIGFHASGRIDQKFRNAWNRLKQWRTTGNNELYNIGGPGINAQGLYQVPSDGYYACAANVRIDATNTGYFRVLIAVNGGIDVNNGMHAIDGNAGSTNYRSLRVAGTVFLKTGNTVSVYVYSQNDVDWKAHKESGFSCGKTYAKQACPVCNVANSNRARGPKCACKTGFTGKITWKNNKPSGKCTPVPCKVVNSNKKAGPACRCADGFSGKIAWKNNKPSGKCTIAKCKVANSNKLDGSKCKCLKGFSGSVRWVGASAVGPCVKCGTNSGFNADLVKTLTARAGWTEIRNWRTNANTELYESNNEFNNAQGRFYPKTSGYYLCNANVALDGFTNLGYSRLIIASNGKRDVNAGLHSIEGNGGSTDYRSLNVAGTLRINAKQYVSVQVYSSSNKNYFIRSESGFSCHKFNGKYGFHADKVGSKQFKTGWAEIPNWRVTGATGLYNAGSGFNRNNGRYSAPKTSVYFCGATIRLDGAARNSYFRINLNLNRAADVNNGFHVIRGNKGSSNYGSMGVAGTIYLKKGNTMSVFVYSRYDNIFNVQTESGWGCHIMETSVGFHADMAATTTYKTGWARLKNWRTGGNNELYAMGGGPNSQGYYKAPEAGFFLCATQVRIDAAMSSTSINQKNRYRLIIPINGQLDIHNGLHVNDGNQGSTNYRSLRVAGTVYLKKGDRASVAVYSWKDASWRVQSESGFSCHKFVTRTKCGIKPPATKPPATKPTRGTPSTGGTGTTPRIMDGARTIPQPPQLGGR